MRVPDEVNVQCRDKCGVQIKPGKLEEPGVALDGSLQGISGNGTAEPQLLFHFFNKCDLAVDGGCELRGGSGLFPVVWVDLKAEFKQTSFAGSKQHSIP